MDWPLVKLYQITEQFISGGTPSTKAPEYWSGDIPWITGADISDRVVLEGRKQITQEAVENSATNIVSKGAILLVTRTGVGKIAKAGVDIAISQDLTGIVLKEKIDPDFVIAAISYKINSLVSLQQGSTIKGILRSDVENMEIPLPSLSEQRRIVDILDQADTLRKKRAEADAKAERILPALFYKMFGDPATNPKSWKVVEMGEIIAETRNGLYKHGDYYGRGTQILKMFNIQDGELNLDRIDLVEVDEEEFENYRLDVGDILLNRVNTPELVGKCAVITPELGRAMFESKNIRVRIKRNLADPDYVAHYLNCPFGHATLRQGVKHAIGMATINNSDLRTTLIPLPPAEQQKTWGEAVRQFRSIRKDRNASKKKIDSLFSNLFYRAFSGDLTAKWREAHMKELLAEIEEQAKELKLAAKMS